MNPDDARLTEPMVLENGRLRVASWEEALNRAAEGFARARAFGRGLDIQSLILRPQLIKQEVRILPAVSGF